MKSFQKIHESVVKEAKIQFTDEMLNKLRDEYSKIDTINPDTPAYQKLRKFIDGLDVEALKQLRDAKVKFVSMLAGNTLMFKHKIK